MKLIAKVPDQCFKIVPTDETKMNINWDHPPEHWMGQQSIQEFKIFVDRMIEHGVKSTVHIGILNGGNEWYIAKRYRELGLTCEFLSIDFMANARAIQTYEILREEFGVHVDLRLADSRNLKTSDLGGPFDACFIDGGHNYDCVKNDFLLLEPIVTKMIGFHDISHIENPKEDDPRPLGTRIFWSEVKKNFKHEEITFEDVYGIGILYKDRQIGLL